MPYSESEDKEEVRKFCSTCFRQHENKCMANEEKLECGLVFMRKLTEYLENHKLERELYYKCVVNQNVTSRIEQ